MSRFDHRSEEAEVMDNLDCDGEVVHQTLRELEFINRWLGGNQVTMEGVREVLNFVPPDREITIVDLGCGSGDMLRLVSQWGDQKNIKMNLVGIDANPHIIEFARNHSLEYPNIRFEAVNIFSDEFRDRKFDVCLATLFTHHFTNEQLIDLFRWFHANVSTGTVVNDIHRHWFAFHSIRVLTRWFSRSAMVKIDAPLSVLRAFSKTELQGLLSDAGVKEFTLRWKWAFRWQLVIRGANG